MEDHQQSSNPAPEPEKSYFWLYYLGLEFFVFVFGSLFMSANAGPDGPINALAYGMVLIYSRAFMNIFLIGAILYGVFAKKEKLKSQATILFVGQLIVVFFLLGMMNSY